MPSKRLPDWASLELSPSVEWRKTAPILRPQPQLRRTGRRPPLGRSSEQPPQTAAPGLFIDQCGNRAFHTYLPSVQREILQLQALAVDHQRSQAGFQDHRVLIKANDLRHTG